MNELNELLRKIKHEKYLSVANKENNAQIYIEHIINEFKSLNIVEKIVLISMYYNSGSNFVLNELIKVDDNVEYFLLYDLLTNNDPRKKIGNELLEKIYLLKFTNGIETLKYSYDYVNSLDNDNNVIISKLNEKLIKLINEFALSFQNNYKILIECKELGINIFDITNLLFSSSYNVPVEQLNQIYQNVMSKSLEFHTFSYKNLFKKDLTLATKIDGIITNIPNENLFEIMYYFWQSDKYNKLNDSQKGELIEKLVNQIEQIYELNKNNEEALICFFYLISLCKEKGLNDELFAKLETKDYYLQYSNSKNLTNIFHNMLEEIKRGEFVEHNFLLLQQLGEEKEFAQLDSLELFMNSNDPNFQRQLIIPIIMKDIKRFKDEFGIDVDVQFNTEHHDNDIGGYYDDKNNCIFINKSLIYSNTSPIEILYTCENIIFHEMRHLKQHKIVEKDSNLTYINLLMAMEMMIHDNNSDYYSENYANISFEQDARAQAYTYVMNYFKNYPEVQLKIRKQFEEKVDLMHNFIKKEREDEKISYRSIFDIFTETVAVYIDKNDDRITQFAIGKFNKYPIISKIFDFDRDSGKIFLRPQEYFDKLYQQYMKEEDSEEKIEALRCLDLIQYEIKITEFIKKHSYYEEELSDLSYFRKIKLGEDFETYEDVVESIKSEVGTVQRR